VRTHTFSWLILISGLLRKHRRIFDKVSVWSHPAKQISVPFQNPLPLRRADHARNIRSTWFLMCDAVTFALPRKAFSC
jgi:hypothetical protein